MSSATLTHKLTISVSQEFYEGLLRSAGPRKIGAFIESRLKDQVATTRRLEEGYKAMGADAESEREAREWSKLSGETLNDEAW